MKRTALSTVPHKRKHRLVIDELPDEVLVYDLDRHQAHCLNRTAAFVWQNCDGKSTATQIAQRLTKKLQVPFNEDLVWLALRQLEKLHLLEQAKSLPVPPQFLGVSRRKMIRNIGLAAAVAVPVITSIVAPTAAEASTCVASGQPCNGATLCCSVLGCVNGTCGP